MIRMKTFTAEIMNEEGCTWEEAESIAWERAEQQCSEYAQRALEFEMERRDALKRNEHGDQQTT